MGVPGLLETIYEEALFHELQLRGLRVRRQVYVSVKYKNQILGAPLHIDFLVEDKVVAEVKASETNHTLYNARVLTYLRLTDLKLGLVLNFGQELLINGLIRVVNNL